MAFVEEIRGSKYIEKSNGDVLRIFHQRIGWVLFCYLNMGFVVCVKDWVHKRFP
jgi:hypothetical protein